MQNSNHIAELIFQQLASKELTEEQKQELQQWLEKSPHNQEVLDMLLNDERMHKHLELFTGINSEAGLLHVQKLIAADGQPESIPFRRGRRWWRYVAAAVTVGIVAVGAFYIRIDEPAEKTVVIDDINGRYKSDILPGGDKATLLLSDGRLITLDSSGKGLIAMQGKAAINNVAGELSYSLITAKNGNKILYNTISTEKGGQYRVILSDGTIAFLNAASSLKFPASFASKQRFVEITGEVYFEVAKDNRRPFKVYKLGTDLEVQVLGTQFNVNTYDSSPKVTLIEGGLRVSRLNSTESKILKPGMQAQVETQQISSISDPDIEQVLAWKNGIFLMKGTDLHSIMKDVERWYNVDVIFKTEVKGGFSGEISRKEPLSKLLMILELTKEVEFEVKEKTVFVLPANHKDSH